ncbi:MAG: bifunctional glutamate N-acetyltransferase/amino-acid acetyltransferase ArgJ, partial [Nitrospirae bacterium]|nr:bifunctional glutamate N-acetyltransferase/amino-acid acetyltransferase ArgJ [Nitrospirota bacterium]
MKKNHFEEIEGGITAVPGFLAGASRAGIKYPDREDLAVVYSEKEAVAAGTFTINRVVASSVSLSRERIRKGEARAIVVNSGNANACTGRTGIRDSLEMTKLTAEYLKIPETQVCIASTGVIGQPLPMDRIRQAIPEAVRNLGSQGGAAARAIMTTDTFPKEVAIRARIGGRWVTVGGMAKGSGMIAPKMATLLGFIGTDMKIGKPFLRKTVREAVAETFNRITVDGDTSTNDMVLCLANGMAGNGQDPKSLRLFDGMLRYVMTRLAKMVVMDGEGATKFIEIRIRRAKSKQDAERAGMAIANSPLVKTTFFG